MIIYAPRGQPLEPLLLRRAIGALPQPPLLRRALGLRPKPPYLIIDYTKGPAPWTPAPAEGHRGLAPNPTPAESLGAAPQTPPSINHPQEWEKPPLLTMQLIIVYLMDWECEALLHTYILHPVQQNLFLYIFICYFLAISANLPPQPLFITSNSLISIKFFVGYSFCKFIKQCSPCCRDFFWFFLLSTCFYFSISILSHVAVIFWILFYREHLAFIFLYFYSMLSHVAVNFSGFYFWMFLLPCCREFFRISP